MGGKTANIVLITVLICVSAFSIYMQHWYILITNVCVISGVLIDIRITKLSLKENVNFKILRILKKIVPILYIVGAISLII